MAEQEHPRHTSLSAVQSVICRGVTQCNWSLEIDMCFLRWQIMLDHLTLSNESEFSCCQENNTVSLYCMKCKDNGVRLVFI